MKIIMVFFVVLICKSVSADSYQFMVDLYYGQEQWKNYSNKTAPHYLRAVAQDGSYSIQGINAGSVVVTYRTGTFGSASNVTGLYKGNDFVAFEGNYAGGANVNFTASWVSPQWPDPSSWSTIFSDDDDCPVSMMVYDYPPPCSPQSGTYGAYMVGMKDGKIYWIATGDCVGEDGTYDIPCEMEDTCSTPTPTPSSSPSPSPTPSPSPSPSPQPQWSPRPEPHPSATMIPDVEAGELDGEFSYDANTGMGTISVSLKMDTEMVTIPDEIYNNELPDVDSKMPLNINDKVGSDDTGVVVDSLVSQADSVLEDGKETWFKSIVDGTLDVLLEHPFLEYFRNAAEIETSDSICEVTLELWGHEIKFGFCDLDNEFEILKVVILAVATVYGAFIVIRGE